MGGMNGRDVRDFSAEISAEVGVVCAILRGGAVPDAIGENGFEAVGGCWDGD